MFIPLNCCFWFKILTKQHILFVGGKLMQHFKIILEIVQYLHAIWALLLILLAILFSLCLLVLTPNYNLISDIPVTRHSKYLCGLNRTQHFVCAYLVCFWTLITGTQLPTGQCFIMPLIIASQVVNTLCNSLNLPSIFASSASQVDKYCLHLVNSLFLKLFQGFSLWPVALRYCSALNVCPDYPVHKMCHGTKQNGFHCNSAF